jgi:uncharacterized protein YfaQ (DUF2300 family)
MKHLIASLFVLTVTAYLSGCVVRARPGVYVQPQPVVVRTQPVYVQPQPVVVQTQPVYVQPQPVVQGTVYVR